MNTKEIEEAVKILRPVVITRPGDMEKGEQPCELSREHKAIQSLLSLAQEYLAVKIPEGKDVTNCDCPTLEIHNEKVIHLCKLAMVKKEAEWKEGLPSEEKLSWDIRSYLTTNHYDDYKGLAQAIHKLLEERIR